MNLNVVKLSCNHELDCDDELVVRTTAEKKQMIKMDERWER